MFVYGTSLAFAALLAVVLLGVAGRAACCAGSVLAPGARKPCCLLAAAAGWSADARGLGPGRPRALPPHGALPIATLGQLSRARSRADVADLRRVRGCSLRSSAPRCARGRGGPRGPPAPAGAREHARRDAGRAARGLGAATPPGRRARPVRALRGVYAVVAALTLDRRAARARRAAAVAAVGRGRGHAGVVSVRPDAQPPRARGARGVLDRAPTAAASSPSARASPRPRLPGTRWASSTRRVDQRLLDVDHQSGARYMSLFVYLPVALRPGPSRAPDQLRRRHDGRRPRHTRARKHGRRRHLPGHPWLGRVVFPSR